ncbi:four-carbon acid sugar kinase family protein [uncultured Cohaesibacter sp.]|uniref:four-carbon acid sugar kinase family protein n=1 Tax=uncultured Cohaesibacter sp. TaxID=1002546 RepID=UPI0029C92CDD|nr:four-carbon acid sugar kinase family protein [uncultured Cohaesibacter sp.]
MTDTGTKQNLLLSFYGDDFTGSTDALESVTMAGIPAMLFLSPPSPEDLKAYPHIRAVGVAGTSRSQTPEWMDEHLSASFKALKALDAPICHYKTCSTFDSAPRIGNIGRAIEIGHDIFGTGVPVVVGVTRLKRYVVFSNLYAAASVAGDSEAFRIDRHPTMSRHPSTPMTEADLRLHLAQQTTRPIGAFDFRRMLSDDASSAFAELCAENDAVILDTFDDATTTRTGQLLHERSQIAPTFVVGSSGVEYALADYLTKQGVLPLVPPPSHRPAVDRMIAICGSCSPTTSRQIEWAEANGFAVVAVDTVALVEKGEEEEQRIASNLVRLASEHKGVVLHTAKGPDDPQIAATRQALERRGLTSADSSPVMGGGMGRVLKHALKETGLSRAILAGGDSSSHAVSAMGVKNMDVAGPLVPGAPLCRVHSADTAIDGVEISLKGGQVGEDNFFGRVMSGK